MTGFWKKKHPTSAELKNVNISLKVGLGSSDWPHPSPFANQLDSPVKGQPGLSLDAGGCGEAGAAGQGDERGLLELGQALNHKKSFMAEE